MDIRLPLPAALRHRVESEDYLWAYVTSLLLSPPVVWAVWTFAIAWTADADRGANLQFASLFAVAVCAAPMLFVSFMVRNGRIGDLNMPESRERYTSPIQSPSSAASFARSPSGSLKPTPFSMC